MNIVDPNMSHGNGQLVSYADSGQSSYQIGAGGISFDYVFNFARRRFWTIFFFTLLGAGIGLAYLALVPAPYTAIATLTIDTRKFQLFQQQPNLGEQSINSSSAIESQLEVLRSENILLQVIHELHLADDPEFGGASSIPIISDLLPSGHPEFEFRRTRNALSVLEKSLKAKRLGAAYVIEISFSANNAERAAQIANAIAEAYIADQLETKYHATRQGSTYLEGRIKELREQVESTQKAVNDYKAQNSIVDAGNGRLVTDQQVSDLNSQLAAARAKTSEARARLDRVNAVLSDNSDASIVGAAASDIFTSELITRMRTQYLEAATRHSEWSEKYGRNHLAAVNLRNTMRAARDVIRSELERHQRSYKKDYEISVAAEKDIEKQLEQALAQSQVSTEAQVTLRRLETSAQTYKALYDNFLRRYTEAVEQQSFAYSEARLITKASPPSQRTYRKTLLIVAMAPFLGLFMGAGLAALREFLDQGLRTSSQVERALHTKCIALVPAQKPVPTTISSVSQGARAGAARQRLITQDACIGTSTVVDQPFSQFAEAIRTVKLALDLDGMVSSSSKIVAVTSSIPGEGKSTVAAALAQGTAQMGARVLLIDCDLRNPSLTRAIAPDASADLLDVLSERVSLEEAVWKDPATGLAFLPTDLKTRIAHSSDILASGAIKKLTEKLRASYDYVVVDLPPLGQLDVLATTHFVDRYFFVIEWGRTCSAIAEHALRRAPHVRERLVGAVLNKVDLKALSLYDGNRARYYNDKSYARYGYTDVA